MANTTLTHKMIAREAAAMLEEMAPFTMNVNRGRQDEFGEAINGYKKGSYVDIKVPPTSQVFDGATFASGGSAPDNVEQSVRLTLDIQKHTALTFTAKEKLLDITEYKDRILRPQMRGLSSVLEAEFLTRAVKATPNAVGTKGTVPTGMITYAQARAKMETYLADEDERTMLFTSSANVNLVDASKALFHNSEQVNRMFLKGTLGEAQNAMWYEHQSIPAITNGSQVAAMAINGATAEGAVQIVTDGGTGTNTITEGTTFTIAGVFAVHPLTGVATADLQQFTVLANVTLAAGAGTITCYPAIKASFPNKTVSALPADNAVVTFDGGTASTAYRQNLMFQKNAFTVATAPLPVLASCEGYTARLPSGISVRVMSFGDGKLDTESTRIDVLAGFAAVRPLHACRVFQ